MPESKKQRTARLRRWRDGLQRIHDAANGVLSVELYHGHKIAAMAAAAMSGNPEAIRAMRIFARTIQQISHLQTIGEPALCACCNRSLVEVALSPDLSSIFHIVAAFPDGEDNELDKAMVTCICSFCADEATLPAKALEGLQKVWPGLRMINIHAESGTA